MRNIIILAAAVTMGAALQAPMAEAQPPKKGCPPGLAKQGRCGQAGHGTRTAPGLQHRRWDRWRDAGLEPAPRGQVYVVIDRRVVLVDETTSDVIRVIGAVADLLN